MLKKITLAILALGSSAVFAGTMGPICAPGDVTVPCDARQWDLGVQALYLKPVYSARRAYEFAPGGFRELEEDWDWGYRLEGSYHFGTGNDLTLTWTHFDSEPGNSGFAGFTPFTGSLAIPFTVAQDDRFDKVDLVVGQHVDMGARKDARFYAGLQYTRIRIDTQYNYLITIPGLAPAGFVQNRNTDFNGAGPVLGVNYAYELGSGLSITANAEGTLLYGSSRYNLNFVFAPSSLVPVNQYASKKSIIAGLQTKLGLNYAHELTQGVLNIEGGYQALDYFDVLQITDVTCGCLKDSDFGLYGPYVGIKWVGYI
jgi:hypothetical protein